MKYLLSFSSVLLSIISVGLWLYSTLTTPKIAYVRSGLVVDKYIGMKESRAVYQQKINEWQANLDTLGISFDHSFEKYQALYASYTVSERKQQETTFASQQEQIEKYRSALEEEAKAEEEKLIQGALNQINSYIKQYADAHKIQVVLGTTQSGNVLYASDAVDITEEIIQGLNQSYRKR